MESEDCKREEEEAGPSSATSSHTLPSTHLHNHHLHHHHHHHAKDHQDHGDDDDEEDDDVVEHHHNTTTFVPGPPLSLKDQIERDKEDDSLRRWKEKLLGCLESDLDIGRIDPEVKFHSIGIVSEDFAELVPPLPVDEKQNGQILFTLREGSRYQLKLKFTVLHNIVSGLTYCNTVWKGGLQVDQSKGMLGTFAPQKEPYIHALKEEITPSGVLARGVYTAKLKFEDDDKKCHMELQYSLEIKKR